MSKTLGIYCLDCGSPALGVTETRDAAEAIRRQRVCKSCGSKMTTIEKIVGKTKRRKRVACGVKEAA